MNRSDIWSGMSEKNQQDQTYLETKKSKWILSAQQKG